MNVPLYQIPQAQPQASVTQPQNAQAKVDPLMETVLPASENAVFSRKKLLI